MNGLKVVLPISSRSYIKACEDKGFTVDAEKSNSSYTATDSEGYKLDLYYNSYDKELRISLDAPKQETDSSNTTDSTDASEADTTATDTGTDTTTTTDNSGSDNPATTDSTTDSGSVTPEHIEVTKQNGLCGRLNKKYQYMPIACQYLY